MPQDTNTMYLILSTLANFDVITQPVPAEIEDLSELKDVNSDKASLANMTVIPELTKSKTLKVMPAMSRSATKLNIKIARKKTQKSPLRKKSVGHK